MEFPDIGLGDHDVPGHLTVAVEQDLGGGELPITWQSAFSCG